MPHRRHCIQCNRATNFRSVTAVGQFVNRVFECLFPPDATAYQAAYRPMQTVHSDPQGALHGIHQITIPKVPFHRKEAIAAHDANRIARYIAWACAGNVTLERTAEEKEAGIGSRARPADFLILTPQRGRLATYARALEKYGAPCNVSGSRGFGDEESVAELVLLL